MAEERIALTSGEEALHLFGRQDRNLKIIGDGLGVKLVLRDGTLRVLGDPAGVERATFLINEILKRIRHGDVPSEEDILSLMKAGTEPVAGDAEFRVQALRHSVTPRSDGQRVYVDAIKKDDVVFVIGPAGTGKTYLAVAAGVKFLRGGSQKKLILARPAVEADEKLGFLPGDFQAKVNPYLKPLYDALEDFLEPAQIRRYLEREIFEVVPLAFMRGRTLNDSFIILDEAQNTTVKQMKMFLTRMGTRSKIIITGDVTQIDLPQSKKSGLVDAIETLAGVEGISFISLSTDDVFRHRLVRDIVDAYRIAENGGQPSDPPAAPEG